MFDISFELSVVTILENLVCAKAGWHSDFCNSMFYHLTCTLFTPGTM